MSCTVLIGTRENFAACGLGSSDTCIHHRAFQFHLPRTPDDLPRTKDEARQGVRTTRSPGPRSDLGLGAKPVQPHRASEDSGSDYGTFVR